MKKLKMLTSILVAIVLCLSFCLPMTVNAADGAIGMDEGKCSITISGQVPGHKFVAYRIFKADLNVADGVKTLSNIEFAHTDETEAAELLAALNTTFGKTGTPDEFTTAAEVADYLSALTGDARQPAAVKFATAANNSLTSVEKYDLTATKDAEDKVVTDASGNTTYSASNMKPGYYLIIDENVTGLEPESSIYSRFILEVAGDVEATAKVEGKPVLHKVVGKMENGNANYSPDANLNSSEEVANGLNKHNTANVGDHVPFKLEINFPNLAEYTAYTFEVKDTLSKGFDFDDNVTMKILNGTTAEGEEGTTVPADMDLVKGTDFTATHIPGGTTDDPTTEITINFNTILAKYTADKTLVGKTIVIEYSATLNDKASKNGTPNTNKAVLTYSNNPRTSTTGTTPEEKTETYTYNIMLNKVDVKNFNAAWGNNQEHNASHVKMEGALSDVVFKLYRVTSAADATTETSEEITVTSEEGNIVPFKTNDVGQVELPGLANGTYYLTEEVAHPGYNKVLGKIYFTISAKYDETEKTIVVNKEGDLTASLPSDSVKNKVEIGVVTKIGETTFDSQGDLYLLISNSTGAQLPSTGGVGTVIFTVVGILVMAAVVVIAVKSNKK